MADLPESDSGEEFKFVPETGDEALAAVDGWVRDFTLTVGDYTYTFDTVAQVAFSKHDLDTAVEEQPGRVAWWGGLVEKLEEMEAGLRRQIKRTRAEIGIVARRSLKMTGKVTEKMVDEYVEASEEVNALEEQLIAVTSKKRQAKSVVGALRDRKDMIEIAADRQKPWRFSMEGREGGK